MAMLSCPTVSVDIYRSFRKYRRHLRNMRYSWVTLRDHQLTYVNWKMDHNQPRILTYQFFFPPLIHRYSRAKYGVHTSISFNRVCLYWRQVTLINASLRLSEKCFTKKLTSVGLTDIYPHTPILHPHAAQFHEWRISNVTLTSAHLYGNVYIQVSVTRVLTDSSDFGLLGKQSSPKCEIPRLRRWWTAVKNFTLLDLSLAEKSITVHTHKKHTNKQ